MRRSRFGLSPIAIVLILSAFGCDADLGTLNGDTEGSSNAEGGSAEDGGFEPCSNDTPCPDGQFCWNGLCALGCTNNGDCADDQYCDTTSMLCHNSEVPSCGSIDDCAGDQICVDGLCTTVDDTSCEFGGSPDGCESNAVCLEDGADTVCYTMPACSEDGTCPTGLVGAVCNDGYLPDKDRVCLLGACQSDTHCPDLWSCIAPGGAVLGTCSSGALGMPCIDGDDCNSGQCTNPLGTVGLCN